MSELNNNLDIDPPFFVFYHVYYINRRAQAAVKVWSHH